MIKSYINHKDSTLRALVFLIHVFVQAILVCSLYPGIEGALGVDMPVVQQGSSFVPVQQAVEAGVVGQTVVSSAKTEEQGDKKDIYLNFENTDLVHFVNYIGELKKLNMTVDKALQGVKVSLTIRDPLSKEGAYTIFLTVLEMAGFSLIKKGDLYVVMPRDRKLMQPLPTFINVDPKELPDSDLEIRYVVFLQNIQVGDIKELVSSMLSQPFMLIDQRDVNGFIITDKSYNVKAAAKLLKELDQMGIQETVTVIKLKEANASDAKNLLMSLITKPEGNVLSRLLGKVSEGSTEYFPPGTRIIAEERTNSLILLGITSAIDKIVDFVTKHIDTALQGTKSPLHTYELKHTDAAQVKAILQEVTAPPADFGPTQQAGRYGAVRGGLKYFKAMKFEVDRDGNRLLISCTDNDDWKLLKKTIQDIDKPQPQVALETLIVSVAANDIKALGGAIRNKNHGILGSNIDFQSAGSSNNTSLEEGVGGAAVSLLGNMLNQLVFQRGVSALSFGKPTNIWAVFSALKSLTNSTILSQPFLTITNKTQGTIEFGETKNVVNEVTETGFASYNTVNASTSLIVTPQINLEGLVRLDLDLNINEFTDPSGNQQEIKQVRTSVTIADGQVLVLGGFVKTKVSEEKYKTPLLGDIPVLGWLFKNQKRTIDKNYIFIFLSPTIIKPRSTPGMQLYTKMKLHDATDQIEEAVETRRTMDPIHNWFFNPNSENYSHKVIDFANARYQPTTVDVANDPYYGLTADRASDELDADEKGVSSLLSPDVIIEARPQQLLAKSAAPIMLTPARKEIAQKSPLPDSPIALPIIPEAPPVEQFAAMRMTSITSPENLKKDISRQNIQKNVLSNASKDTGSLAQENVRQNKQVALDRPVNQSKINATAVQKVDPTKGNSFSSSRAQSSSKLDETISSKRKKLKELFAAPDEPQHYSKKRKEQDQRRSHKESLDQKRERLKKLFSHNRHNDLNRRARAC